ncbi:MAG: sialidase family protein [Acidobacteriota bacterium]
MKPIRIVLCLLFIALLAVPTFAEGKRGDMTESERRDMLRPTYEALQSDDTFASLRTELDGKVREHDVVEAYLAYLPISPLEYLEIDMHARRYEHMVPPFILEWHERWIELHEEKAREIYGDSYVDDRLSKRTIWVGERYEELPEGLLPEVATRATVGTNRNPAGSNAIAPDAYQGEIQIAVNPNNPRQIVAGANTFDAGPCGTQTQAVVYSSDGGTTWDYTCVPGDTAYPGINCTNFEFGSDPAVGWNNNNEVFLEYMLLCSTGSTTQYSIVIAKSTDGGATWSGHGIIANSFASPGTIEDKQFLAIDNNPGSPFFGRMYTCWDRSNNERSAYSTDGGATWNEVDLPTPPGGGLDLGCELEVEDNGTVHVVFNTLTCFFNCSNERMFYTRSTNGGLSWSSPTLVRDFNLVGFSGANFPDAQDNRGIGPFGAIGIDNSGGPCDGTLYAVFTDFQSGGVNNTDIGVSRSTNGGNTWSAPIVVNDDGLTNRVQFHPFLVVDQSNGTPVVAWHDARNDAGNDATDIYLSRSLDCGLTWEANTQVSQPSAEFNNSTISFTNMNTTDNPAVNPNQAGEYLGLDALGGKAYVSWSDTRMYFPNFGSDPADENFGFAVVDFATTGGGGDYDLGTEITDEQIRTVSITGVTSPRVAMGPASLNGAHEGEMRLQNVGATSFQHRFQEWDFRDGNHTNENAGWIAVADGPSTIGTLAAEGGSVSLGTGWTTINFTQTFSAAPVVVPTVTTVNDAAAVTIRVRNVTATSFQARLQEEEAADNVHANEDVHWVAIEVGTTTVGSNTFLVGRTGDVVTHQFSTINFGQTLSNPVLVAAAQRADGGNTANVRYRNLTSTSVEVQIDEEISLDAEVNHTTEDVGYFVISN